ncbi:MAG: porin [Methyloceanibacter sp.]|uniref:porin n=1 Tax=Methyloceanibacter sp. TaxID=1965321 RepID=UPI003D9B1AC4
MDMFGGLTKTSSRIAIAAAFGLTLGGYALSSGPALAADFGGDCCADLEERVAELEATTVRKGNKKVSVTLSGWVVKTVSWWDDGDLSEAHVGDKDADLTSRFAITGSATIAPGWSGGYNITVTVPGAFAGQIEDGNVFGINSDQFDEDSGLLSGINTLYSYMYVKSDTFGAINWGYLSPASDNPAVLADLSGTVIESNGVWFEGSGFFLRPKGGGPGLAGLSTLTTPVQCNSGVGNIGVDCYGAPQSGVRYDSPTWGGFRFEASWSEFLENFNAAGPGVIPNIDVYDVAVFYNGDWGNFKVSAAYSYTHMDGNLLVADFGNDVDLHQAGATIMHVPSGLGLYGMYQHDALDGSFFNPLTGTTQGFADTDAWYLKPFIKRTWNPAGATVLYGEYGQYNDQLNGLVGNNLCAAQVVGTNAGNFCGANLNLFATGSEVERWGLGVVQEIDSAAMHLFARWQHSDVSIDFEGLNLGNLEVQSVGQNFDDLDIFQVGGIIFF